MDGYWVTLRQYLLRKIRYLELWYLDVGNCDSGIYALPGNISSRCYAEGLYIWYGFVYIYKIFVSQVRDGYRLEKPEHCRRELYNIMYYCWSHDPQERPLFAEIIQMLDKLLHTEMDYIELERFPDHNYYNIVSLSGEKL